MPHFSLCSLALSYCSFLALSSFLLAKFPKCSYFLTTRLPDPRTSLIARHFHKKKKRVTQKPCMQKCTNTNLSPLANQSIYTQKHARTDKPTLSSLSLPWGVNTSFYLVAMYQHRINSFPFLAPPFGPADIVLWAGMICSVYLKCQSLSSQSPLTCVTRWNNAGRATIATNGQASMISHSYNTCTE